MVELVDKAQFRATQQGPTLVRQAAALGPADQHLAAIGAFEKTGDVQQCRLAGARRPDHRARSMPFRTTSSLPPVRYTRRTLRNSNAGTVGADGAGRSLVVPESGGGPRRASAGAAAAQTSAARGGAPVGAPLIENGFLTSRSCAHPHS